MEWIVCKNQTANKEVRLSDSHVHGQGVFRRQDCQDKSWSHAANGERAGESDLLSFNTAKG